MDPMGIDIQYAILAKKAFIDLPRSGVKKHKLNHLGKGKIFTVYTSEVEQFAPEKLPKPKKERIVLELAPFSRGKMLNFRWVKFRGTTPQQRGIPSHPYCVIWGWSNPKLHT